MNDEREREERIAWLARCDLPASVVEPLAGDVSARRYFRVRSAAGESAILAEYPPELLPASRRFVESTALLAAAGVRVPAVRAVDSTGRRMLLEDLGPTTLYDRRSRSWAELEPWLLRAVETRAKIAALDPRAVEGLGSPPLDADLLRRELAQTMTCFLVPHELAGAPAQAARLERAFDELCARLGADPAVPCHRDFMARNLVPREPLAATPDLAVLDHQDLRLGPPAYDLAALLNDSLFPPPPLVERLLAAASAGFAPPAYWRATAQRALKAVGTFAAFAARGDSRHLPLVPPTFARALAALTELPETAAIARQLAPRWRAFLGAADGSATLTGSGAG